jgi:hypothetical protein
LAPEVLPPSRNRFHGACRGVRRHAHVDHTGVALDIKDALGRDAALGVGQNIMHVDGLGFLPPSLAGVFQVADQCFFLGIDADNGLPRRDKVLFLDLNIAKLRVAVGG